ncbi:MAG: DUF4097 domain-containing protein [Acidobacteriota bacterium]|nr:DUF4097 domain-containing protein [Acidobacteriota bacterium]
MIRHTLTALFAATSIAAPALGQTVAAIPATPARPVPRVIIEQQREIERERMRTAQRENRVEQTERLNHTFKIGGNGELQVSNWIGDITITRGGGNEVRVEAVKTARARTEEQARELLPTVRVEFKERGGRAEVKTIHSGDNSGHSNQRNASVAVAYSITAPQGTRINVSSFTGNIAVTGVKGELSLVSLSGDVKVVEGARVSKATSTSGSVEIRGLQSDVPLEASSTSGNITVAQSRAPRMELVSISGSVTLDNIQAEQVEASSTAGDLNIAFPFAKGGRYELNTLSGSVRITLMNDTGFELDASTFSGSVQSAVTLVERGGVTEAGRRGRVRRLNGRFGDGTALLDVSTFSGSVIITKK